MNTTNGFVHNIYMCRSAFLGDKTAIYDYDLKRAYSYKEIDERSDRVAACLTQVYHVEKGERIGICALNRVEFFDLFFACYKTGIILSTYNGKLMDWELSQLIENETPKLVFADSTYIEKINGVRKERLAAFEVIDLDAENGGIGRFLSYDGAFTAYEPDMEDILMLIHTGGTTGLPKAAMISYRAIVFNSVSTILSHELNSSDVTYLMLPLFHTAAWNSISLGMFLAGGKIILKKKFDVSETYDIIQNERPSFLLAVPTIYVRLAEDPRFETTDFSCIKSLRCGAAPLPMALFETYDRKNLPLCNSYGLTECGPSNFSFPMRLTSQETLRRKAGFVGRPYHFNKVRIVDEQGEPVSPNTPGDLEFSGPLTFSGYWNNEEESVNARDGEWVRTGDIAICDEEGFYKIIGRRKNMFISGGENIFPIEIENILMAMDEVEDCGVIGVEDSCWGEVGKAFIRLRDGAGITEEDIRARCKKKLPSIKIPKYIAFVKELPRNGVGKLMYARLHEM